MSNHTLDKPSHLLTLPEAMEYLKISKRHMSRLLAEGRLAAVRIGYHCVRIRLSTLEAFITKNTV